MPPKQRLPHELEAARRLATDAMPRTLAGTVFLSDTAYCAWEMRRDATHWKRAEMLKGPQHNEPELPAFFASELMAKLEGAYGDRNVFVKGFAGRGLTGGPMVHYRFAADQRGKSFTAPLRRIRFL